jgi:hypothetical protein
MRKNLFVFLLAAICLAIMSCFNAALPEQMHIKAEINPNIPANSGRFNFSELFQKELNTLFSGGGGEEGIKVFDYTGDSRDGVQKYLISFSMQEQTLDFEKYFNQDLSLNSSFQNIRQTFTLDPLADAGNNKIALDMSGTITDIVDGISFPKLRPVPFMQNHGTVAMQPISIAVKGFRSLSFYEGYLAVTFSVSFLNDNLYGKVTLRDLKINSISSAAASYTLTAGSPKVEVLFPLKNEMLDNSFLLSFSMSSNAGGELASEIGFSRDIKLKTAKGVSFSPISGRNLNADEIAAGVPPEFVQARIESGFIILDTSAMKGINLGLNGIRISQDDNNDAPLYKGQGLKEGLGSVASQGGVFNAAGQKFNPKPIKIGGIYSMSAADRNSTEITFTEDEKLEIPVSFALKKFGEVYVNGQKIIEEFNQKNGTIEEPLGALSQTVSAFMINEAGVELTFGESRIEGLNIHVQSEQFKVNKSESITPGKKMFTNVSSNNESPFYFKAAENPTVTFNLALSAQKSGGTSSVLKLPSMTPGEEVVIIDCQPKVVFDWEEAVVKPQAASGTNTFTAGKFPANGETFSLAGRDLEKFLNNIEFEEVKGYLFLSGPKSFGDGKTLTLTSFPGTAWAISPEPRTITMLSEPLRLPEEDQPFTENISKLKSSIKPVDFTGTFNRMLPGGGAYKGKPLSIAYSMNLGNEFTIKKDDVEGGDGIKSIKADLVIILPLKLKAGKGGAEIDMTEYLGEMKGRNLLSFTDTDQSEISFNALTLNISLSGSPVQGGQLIIERNTNVDGTDKQIAPVNLGAQNIRIALAEYLTGQKFTLEAVRLKLDEGGSLQISRGLCLLSIGVTAGLDATFDL